MIQLLHLSDLHIHESHKDNASLFKRLAFIRENYLQHHRVITGDETDDGSDKQYKIANRLLLSFVSYICPGNHDYGYAGNLFEKKRARRFDDYLLQTRPYSGRWSMPVMDTISTEAVLIGLDSNLMTRRPWDFACGKIGLWQRYWLKRILRWHANKVRIVYFHHHPFDRTPWMGMKDAKPLMKVLQGNCELVLFGHKHQPGMWVNEHGVALNGEYHVGRGLTCFIAAGKLDERDTVTEIAIEDRNIRLREVPVIDKGTI